MNLRKGSLTTNVYKCDNPGGLCILVEGELSILKEMQSNYNIDRTNSGSGTRPGKYIGHS